MGGFARLSVPRWFTLYGKHLLFRYAVKDKARGPQGCPSFRRQRVGDDAVIAHIKPDMAAGSVELGTGVVSPIRAAAQDLKGQPVIQIPGIERFAERNQTDKGETIMTPQIAMVFGTFLFMIVFMIWGKIEPCIVVMLSLGFLWFTGSEKYSCSI